MTRLRQVAKVLAAQPCILSFSLTDNLMPKFNFIQSRLGTTRQEFGKMVAKFPALLTLSIDKNLAPKLDLLLEEASVPAETLIRSPQLLGYSLENRILPRYTPLPLCRPPASASLSETICSWCAG
jgi:hypothetical protein